MASSRTATLDPSVAASGSSTKHKSGKSRLHSGVVADPVRPRPADPSGEVTETPRKKRRSGGPEKESRPPIQDAVQDEGTTKVKKRRKETLPDAPSGLPAVKEKASEGERGEATEVESPRKGDEKESGLTMKVDKREKSAQHEHRTKKHKTSKADEPPIGPQWDIEQIQGDASLSDTAKSSLEYVLGYVTSHQADPPSATWKFNKKRQAWLLRHIWDEGEIPRPYVNLAAEYLKTVQGGTRDGLVEAATKTMEETARLEGSGVSLETSEAVVKDGAEKEDEKDGDVKNREGLLVMRERAQLLLRLLQPDS